MALAAPSLTTRPRRSTSAVSFSDVEARDVSAQLDKIRRFGDSGSAPAALQSLLTLRQLIADHSSPHRLREAFRSQRGFPALLDLQRRAAEQLASGAAASDTLDLLQASFRLLSTALHDHWGNQRFFQTKAEGWNALRQPLRELLEKKPELREKLLGILLACALDDDSLGELFLRLGRSTAARVLSPDLVRSCETALESALGNNAVLQNPEALVLLFELWKLGRTHHDAASLFAPTAVRVIGESSGHALAALHRPQLLSWVLPALELDLDAGALNEVKRLALTLLSVGVPDIRDAKFLFRAARRNRAAADTLQKALAGPPTPPCFHFDLGLHGYSSIELPDLGRTFPPVSHSAGYTLSLWMQVSHFDSELHTTLFGAFDPSQTCFVLVYLEKDTRNLILQTSVTASRPSVRFKAFVFEPQRWYHICIVHKRPKSTTASRASLFVDGEFVEQAKAQYPASPPAEGEQRRAVQAFLGTPQDLATKTGPGSSSLRWMLASAHLFNEALSDDLISVYKELGPRYYGNYQDCLGSFQTYRASAALNLRNETIHPGKEEMSEIVAAIRSKAASLLPEHCVLLNISPVNTFGDTNRTAIETPELAQGLSKRSTQNLNDATRGGRNVIAINGSAPSINDSLLRPLGIALLTGQPAVVSLYSLDDACWSIGGCCAVCLAMLEAAETKDDVLHALDIIFGTIRYSWRNSEAMERENGFGVLSSLLTTKLQHIVPTGRIHKPFSMASNSDSEDFLLRVLTVILEFVGYDTATPENSVINNPLAYRILLVDLDIWRSAPSKVQRLYYDQFSTFGVGSKYHVFNAKRLARMRIVKRWLEALKGDNFYFDTIDHFLSAFKSLLNTSPSAEALRTMALYITFAIHKPKESVKQKKSLRNLNLHLNTPRRQSATPSLMHETRTSDREADRPLTRAEVGTKVLSLYADILCENDPGIIRKFAKTVTNRWLLFLLSNNDPQVVIFAVRILARVLVVNGPGYVEKFAEKTGGFVIMQSRLRKWWKRPELWVLCFAILFGRDVATLELSRTFDLYGLLDTYRPADVDVVYPDITPVIIGMLQTGLKFIMQGQQDATTPIQEEDPPRRTLFADPFDRGRSMSVVPYSSEIAPNDKLGGVVKTIQTMTRFLSDLHTNSPRFKDFAAGVTYVQELLFLLFPVVVGSDVVSPEMELTARESMTFQGDDVVMRPLSQNANKSAPIVRTATVEAPGSSSHIQPLKRGSSFVLVTSEESKFQPSPARLEPIASPKRKTRMTIPDSHALIEDVLEIIVAVFSEHILHRKDFQGIGLFMKVPPGFQEHQAYFETYILRNLVSSLGNTIKLDSRMLLETRVITNLGRFCTHLDEAVYEGWFIDGAEAVLDFIGNLLEHFQQPDVKNTKSVRLCSEIIVGMRSALVRITLLRMSEYDESPDHAQTAAFLRKLTYWHMVLFSENGFSDEMMRLFFYLLYTDLISAEESVRDVAANLWRLLLVQRSEQAGAILRRLVDSSNEELSTGLQNVLEQDNSTFLAWIDDHRGDLDALFFGKLSQAWESFVNHENRNTQDSFKSRVVKRREKLKIWASDEARREDVSRKHNLSSEQWHANIYAAEHLKRQRSVQDQQDSLAFNISSWTRMQQLLHRPFGLFEDEDLHQWQLDLTEGRNRMRMRLIPDRTNHDLKYQSRIAKLNRVNSLALETKSKPSTPTRSPVVSPAISEGPELPDNKGIQATGEHEEHEEHEGQEEEEEEDDDFEMVDEPEADQVEDKNRKVMRSLQRGDQVEHVHNISRIIGLEACEGLLIIGKMSLYLIDNFFQRSDGEIVDAAQAPSNERDSYLQMISGRSTDAPKPAPVTHETRSWHWEDILSISKRRFLFRDVAIEVFFVDGRSYLLTIHNPQLRNELYQRLMNRAQSVSGGINSPHLEDQWRIESLRTPEDNPQTLGSRFTSVFAQGISNPATRKWIKGEISNFHYLMLVNTMAGRTFNDLTQYPVFPWVLADYTSEELDLSNPRTFRDLSKPMGCQTPERQAEFRERYQSFAEMGDQPPFHYGTHYSSAMIVTSYLIRLQPFVQSYLLLQGGVFDHPDRLFYSIERTWMSASRDNMTDVRELIPEFYYLPEMFVNMNKFDFGERQGDGMRINDVALPPWAKGDPKIFVAKHREALESPYVTRNLHRWIDLVFGHKQRGDAAREATNVFHHLSYRGAKNLDEINDPVERLATIGIIHNFGQTPHQVFQRAHPPHDAGSGVARLDSLAETLTRVPFPLLETQEPISSLLHSPRNERLLCSGPFRLRQPPTFDNYMEWGFADGSVRFFPAGGQPAPGTVPLALFEHVHHGQLTAALFVDSRTLVTAGTDCVVTVWSVTGGSSGAGKPLDLQPRGTLFGHERPATVLAASRAFSTLLSASPDGQVLLWDLNRLTLVRAIAAPPDVTCAAVGDVTGRVLVCAGARACVFSLNGERLLDQHACAEGDELIGACALHEAGGVSGAAWSSRELVLTGHRRGVVNVWGLVAVGARWGLELVKRLVDDDPRGDRARARSSGAIELAGDAARSRERSASRPPKEPGTITSILALDHAVYTGDSEGRVHEWDCIQREPR